MEDSKLLREYSEQGSERAFTDLVDRHLGLVYSTALRRVGNPQAAEDITMSVFCLLAKKARRLKPETVVAGWLHRAVCLATAKYWRTESRRQRHELEAAMMIPNTSASDTTWDHLAPHLDDALDRLDDDDRHAMLLRFFQRKPFREVGQALGITEDAARMRINRALERLRLSLQRKEVVCTATALGTLLAGNAVEAVPAVLASTVGANAIRIAGATSAASSLSALVTWLAGEKLKATAIVGVIALTSVVGLRVLNPLQPTERTSEVPVASAATPDTNGNTAKSFRPAKPKAAPSRPTGSMMSDGDAKPSLTARELYERGLVHQREKRYDEALADLTKSIELLEQGIGRWQWAPTPGAPPKVHAFDSLVAVYFSRSSVLSHKKDYANAIADLTRMLEFEPKRYEARSNRALYHTYLRNMDAAIADYSAIIADSDTDFSHNLETKEKLLAHTYEYRGRVYEGRKEYDKAIADYTESLRVDQSGGDNMIVYWRRGLLYQASQQIDKALEDANSLSQWALQWATAADSKDSDRDRALTAARFGSEIFKHQQPYQVEVLAATSARAGDFNEALYWQQRAIDLPNPATEDQRSAMQARLDLYKTRKPLEKAGK